MKVSGIEYQHFLSGRTAQGLMQIMELSIVNICGFVSRFPEQSAGRERNIVLFLKIKIQPLIGGFVFHQKCLKERQAILLFVINVPGSDTEKQSWT